MTLVPLQSVREHVLGRCAPLAPATVAVGDALGSVAADDVRAPESVPPFANSAMDGFAVRSADVTSVPVSLDVIATIAAGDDPSAINVGAGQAARIMTGAAVPSDADAVVMIEETDGGTGRGDGRVEIRRSVGAGDFVRGIGDDVHAGDVVVRAGELLTPARVALLSGVGCTDVSVVRPPRVGVLSTGDELAAPGAPLRHGQIRDSNRALLTGILADSGMHAVDLGRVIDDRDVIAKALRDAVDSCDAVLTSGGVSVGDFDYLAPVLDELGEQWTFRIAIKPAKPFVFGLVGRVPVFALPGNPVSAAISFELLARPALRRMAGFGDDDLDRPRVTAVAAEELRRRPDGKTHYVRVSARWADDGRVHVQSAGGQGSHMLSSLSAANALAVLPDGDGITPGDNVDILLLDFPTRH